MPGKGRPRLVEGFGTLSTEASEAAEQLRTLIGSASRHGVRHYGSSSKADASDRQVDFHCDSTDLGFEAYLALLDNGAAADLGLYWAKYCGDEQFQKRVRAMLGLACEMTGGHRNLGPFDRGDRFEHQPLHLWWAPNGHCEQLHYDAYDNVHFTLRGTKVWRLFPPGTRDLSPASMLSSLPSATRAR